MRLIDADMLNNTIESDFDGVCVYDVEPSEAVMDFQRIVDEQPTAYDIDKVIEQLGELIEQNVGFMRATPEANSYIKAIRDAIEIVKRGEQE